MLGVGKAGEEGGFQADLSQPVVDPIKILQTLGFVAERLNDLLTFDQLVDQRGLLPPHNGLFPEIAVGALRDKTGGKEA